MKYGDDVVDINKTHWLVIKHCHFTGNEYIETRRRKRLAAIYSAKREQLFVDSDEYYFFVKRSDEFKE